MSFATLHSPKLSLTSSFGSSLNLAEHLDDSEIWQAYTRRKSSLKKGGKSPKQLPHPLRPPDEETPLVPPTKEEAQAALLQKECVSLSLLVTILVVTLGSSFQFGYGTGV